MGRTNLHALHCLGTGQAGMTPNMLGVQEHFSEW